MKMIMSKEVHEYEEVQVEDYQLNKYGFREEKREMVIKTEPNNINRGKKDGNFHFKKKLRTKLE